MKIILIALFVLVLANAAFTQTGGFSEDQSVARNELRSDPTFIRAEKLARDNYLKNHSQNLGELVKVSHQVVSGVNYRLIFESKSGLVQVTVYCQPWTETYEVLESKPYNEEN